jgi:hypothetical protein
MDLCGGCRETGIPTATFYLPHTTEQTAYLLFKQTEGSPFKDRSLPVPKS